MTGNFLFMTVYFLRPWNKPFGPYTFHSKINLTVFDLSFRTSKDNYGGIIQMAELSFINRGFDVFVEGKFFIQYLIGSVQIHFELGQVSKVQIKAQI